MPLYTEEVLKQMFHEGKLKAGNTLHLLSDDKITPSGRSFLHEKKIEIRHAGTNEQEGYKTLFGANLQEKPEHMTHLRGNVLVFKNHPRIRFRGVIDSLQSEIILVQLEVEKLGLNLLSDELQEVMSFLQNLIRCEVSGEELGHFFITGLDEEALRSQSHHPSQFFGIKHFVPDRKYGFVCALLNRLRTLAREAELSAYEAFTDPYGAPVRNDIMQALNRLSSLFWIMMFRLQKGVYGKETKQ
ncbi:MAG: cobalamin adenosyltransferase [Clostridiales bacterium]|nr:cobalamin adenosyltransferase [Clostridiales bacterium]